jgi:hypothetical protein
MPENRFSVRQMIGFFACRILTPAWIAAGAATKLITADPGLLPRNTVLRFAATRNIDFDLWLSLLISAEWFAVCIMVFLARFAKPVAIMMLGTFCVILIIEIQSGAKNCGCLGRFSPPPWQMLTIDAAILALVLIGRSVPLRIEQRHRAALWGVCVAGSLILTAVTFFHLMLPRETAFVFHHAPASCGHAPAHVRSSAEYQPRADSPRVPYPSGAADAAVVLTSAPRSSPFRTSPEILPDVQA